jgi:hypothetical protein
MAAPNLSCPIANSSREAVQGTWTRPSAVARLQCLLARTREAKRGCARRLLIEGVRGATRFDLLRQKRRREEGAAGNLASGHAVWERGSRAAGKSAESTGVTTVYDRWSRGGKRWCVGQFRKTEREMGWAQCNSGGRRQYSNLKFKRI